ncbi:MAG: energy transducer TonB [Saprospiraceae bacterium]|nr:energy transducer TonB [Saprospiraceae bacterium]
MQTLLIAFSALLLGFNPYPEPSSLTNPQFPGGSEAMSIYFDEYLQYPFSARESGLEGEVVVSFIVEKSGSVTTPHVVKGLSPECDAAALRAVVLMPKWTPARNNGDLVRCRTAVRLVFRLN